MPVNLSNQARKNNLLLQDNGQVGQGEGSVNRRDGDDLDLGGGQHHTDGTDFIRAPVGIHNHMVSYFVMWLDRLQEEQ